MIEVMRVCKLALAIGVACGPASALADGDPAAYDPGLATLDRQTATSTLIGQLSYLYVDTGQVTNKPIIPIRIDAYGSYFDPTSRFGGYAQLPLAMVFDSSASGSSALGDLEAGVIYAPRLCRPTLGLVLHAGITAPTGSIGPDPPENSLADSVGRARLTDYYLTIPRAVSIREGVSAIWHSGRWFVRGDVGLDVNLYRPVTAFADTMLRVNAAGGTDLGAATIALEVASSYTVNQSSDFTLLWLATGAVSARFRLDDIEPYVAVEFPLDTGTHQIPFGKFDVALAAGIAARL